MSASTPKGSADRGSAPKKHVDGASAEPVAAKTLSTVPLTGGAQGETLWVHATGFSFLD
jgi:hypothetical protein